MELKEIYRPIEEELNGVEEVLRCSLKKTENESISRINNFLIESPGKRIRPALVILSAKATLNDQPHDVDQQLIKVASAIELVHMASLVHDDVIDHSPTRHNRPTINAKWGEDVSIALGDYLYSVAFELAGDSVNPDIISCMSSAVKAMCEGELIQVCERGNLDLLKERYIIIVKKKTAALFAASCQVGALISTNQTVQQGALREYGLNFGIAFQIIDDYLDLVGEECKLGKAPGQDIGVGEITLPLLNLFDTVKEKDREQLKTLLAVKGDKEALMMIQSKILNSDVPSKTRKAAASYIDLAKVGIGSLSQSPYKKSLIDLASFAIKRGFNG
ncbi:MAG: polyprenyl synthetase family protein [Candidatus Omnitrophota bacterium]